VGRIVIELVGALTATRGDRGHDRAALKIHDFDGTITVPHPELSPIRHEHQAIGPRHVVLPAEAHEPADPLHERPIRGVDDVHARIRPVPAFGSRSGPLGRFS
jgi:hypothetical protein